MDSFLLKKLNSADLKLRLLSSDPLQIVQGTTDDDGEGMYEVVSSEPLPSIGIIFPVGCGDLGDRKFMEFYGVKANLYTGAMAKGIASAELVIAMGQANMLASFGAGGLTMSAVEKALSEIKSSLNIKPFAVNLIHSPFDPNLEEGNVELFKKHGVNIVEASAFMDLTPSVILYRATGLQVVGNKIIIAHKLIAKCSRTEVAEKFLRVSPLKMLDKLLAAGKITIEQHFAAQLIPVADDVCVEADSGGHTDNRPMQVVLPLIISLRDKIFREQKLNLIKAHSSLYYIEASTYDYVSGRFKNLNLSWPLKPRVGAGGGIGCPEAALAAYNLGAGFLVTGTINQMCRESGTCDIVREYLTGATYSDVIMAPAADMFEQGVKLQVLKKGTMFPSRARKLYQLFTTYDSFEQMPLTELQNLEKRIFKKTVAEVWQETKDRYKQKMRNPAKIEKVEIHGDTKLKMSLCMRWYLGNSSAWANRGEVDRKTDYQIWCGPAIGPFNNFIEGTWMDPKIAGRYPSVIDANLEILRGAAYLSRVQMLKATKSVTIDLAGISAYKP